MGVRVYVCMYKCKIIYVLNKKQTYPSIHKRKTNSQSENR